MGSVCCANRPSESTDIVDNGRSVGFPGADVLVCSVGALSLCRSAAGDPLRGLSVHFLSTTLLQYLNDAGFTGNNNVYDIEEKVIRGLSQANVCPRDGRQGSAFVDGIEGEDNVGLAKFMLSYTWGYKVRDIVDSLVAYCKDCHLALKRTYIWLCCMCINQHRVKEAQCGGDTEPSELFAKEFNNTVKGIGHVLALMAPWSGPKNLERVWCVYEMYIAASDASVKLDIIMPPEEADGFMCYSEDKSWDINRCVLWESLKRVRVEMAEASVQEDKQHILALIENSCDFVTASQIVTLKLQTWVSDICWAKAHSLLDGADIELGGLASARVSRFFVELGKPDKALKLLAKAQERLANASAKASVASAAVKTIASLVKEQSNDFQGAFVDLLDAYYIREAANALDTSAAAELLEWLAVAEAKRGDPTSAIEKLTRAARTRGDTKSMESPDGAGLLANIGLLSAFQDDYGKAMMNFDNAQRIRIETGTLETPRGGHLLVMKAVVEAMQGHSEVASDLCNEAHRLLDAVAASHTKYGADRLMVKALVLALSEKPEDVREALANYSSASEMLLEFEASPTYGKSWSQPSVYATLSQQGKHIKRQLTSKSFLITLLE